MPRWVCWVPFLAPALALGALVACSSCSGSSGGAGSPDGSMADQTAEEAAPSDGGPRDSGPGDAETQGDAPCPGVPVDCISGIASVSCPAGCACIMESNNQRIGCFCGDDEGGAAVCAVPTCGSISCVPPLLCDAGGPLTGKCTVGEGADASARDGGSLCTNGAGVFGGSPGTCNGQTCAPGCACLHGTSGGACFCTAPRGPDAGSICVAPTCGNIFCPPGCTCSDNTAGTCECP
jgi:hypothetical protein